MAEKGLKVEFEEFEPEEDPELKKNPSIKNFFVMTSSTSGDKKENKNPRNDRAQYFKDLKMESASIGGFLKRNWNLNWMAFYMRDDEMK